jgi:hypothetical protein
LLSLLITACVPTPHERDQLATSLAAQADMRPFQSEGHFPLAGYVRIRQPGKPLWVFIAGDGFAWVTPTMPSRNPTPINPVALRLAAADPAGNVIYLARPGQYVSQEVPNKYWLDARFSQDVVTAMLEVIHTHLSRAGTKSLYLVGYSGGGAIATLMAESLVSNTSYKVLGLITVAGNLDTTFWTNSRNLSPLTESLNPADHANALASVPQLHLTGSRDKDVPTSVLSSFLNKMGDTHCVTIMTLPLPHAGPWATVWQKVRHNPLTCH